MPRVEGDRSDCQPEANSIAGSRRLRAMERGPSDGVTVSKYWKNHLLIF